MASLFPKPFLFKKGLFGFFSGRRFFFGSVSKNLWTTCMLGFRAARLNFVVESGNLLSDQSENSGFGQSTGRFLFLAVGVLYPDPLAPGSLVELDFCSVFGQDRILLLPLAYVSSSQNWGEKFCFLFCHS